MKMVIDIPDEMYDTINRGIYSSTYDGKIIRDIVLDGTPLPKGHGALKDTDKIISDGISKGFCDWYDEIKYAETIIEAEKEGD